MKAFIFIIVNIVVFMVSISGLFIAQLIELKNQNVIELLPSIIATAISNCIMVSASSFLYIFFFKY